MKLFLSPHHDDETLFGAFTLLREKPLVVVCTRALVQERRGAGVAHDERAAETNAAMAILGCEWVQWDFSDVEGEFDQDGFTAKLTRLYYSEDIEHIYAPAFEEGGHWQHNEIAAAAATVGDSDERTHYLTYTSGRSRSWSPIKVPYEQEWIQKKLLALLCYRSQIMLPSTGHHFLACQDEFYAA